MRGQRRLFPVVSLAPFYLQSLGRVCHAAFRLGHDVWKLCHSLVTRLLRPFVELFPLMVVFFWGAQFASTIWSVVFFLSTSDSSLLETQAWTFSQPRWPMYMRNWAAFCVSDHLFASKPSSKSSISSLHHAKCSPKLPSESIGGTCLVAILVFFSASFFFWVVRNAYHQTFFMSPAFFLLYRQERLTVFSSFCGLVVPCGFAILLCLQFHFFCNDALRNDTMLC